ncbi:Ig-like domain-containing protein [Pseudoalteromonas sp. McH1-42]|uniref:Ig-like domain-containing protein n=1 Tax=Pseudoalteromonas sp. McH1-42 TaxID=2917752 RepID=UPI001EF61F6E|nr:Ig-like domain-containing protein [Pseudoalteromonas sp. McH1-42]MCG7561549.1 Ig-like domain-containing protein [Pseudoalteromonas sp. McH1-42]
MYKLSPVASFFAAMSVFGATASTAPVSIHSNQQLESQLIEQLQQSTRFFQSRQAGTQPDLEFKIHSRSEDGKHLRRSQYYQGVRVHGGEIVTHHDAQNLFSVWFSPEGNITGVSGSVVPAPKLDSIVASIDEEKALSSAKASIPDLLLTHDEQVELVVYPYQNGFRLAYMVTFFAETEQAPSRPEFFIDAHSAEILSHVETLTHGKIGTGPGGNEKIGRHYYGEDKPKFYATERDDGRCALAHDDIRVIDMEHDISNTETFVFDCHENQHKSVNGAYSPLNDAMYYGKATLEMFDDWYSSRALEGDLVMRVHYRENYLNAFWNGKEVTFGDGNLSRYGVYPFTSLGVVAHEIAHGVTSQNSKLVYSSMSGGVNEAFSDMTSEALECFLNQDADGNCEVDWLIGASIFKNRTALRYMDDPTKDGKSIGHADDYTIGLDVHYSSGVFNKAFYLLSTTPGWGVKKAYEVMLHANKHYWVYNGNFESLACGVTDAAEELGYNIEDVGTAFKQVGVFACTENKAPEITITNPDEGSRFKINSALTFSADAKDDYGEVAKVTFMVDGEQYQTLTEAPFEVRWQSDQSGTYQLSAVVEDNEGLRVTSEPVRFTLIDPNQCQTPQWRESQVYVQGNKAAFDGYEYTAKWWNRGQSPAHNSGSWGVWQRGVECGLTQEQPNQAPELTFLSPANNLEVSEGSRVEVALNATDQDGEVKEVLISVNGQLLTKLSRTPYAFNFNAQQAGEYTLSAVAVDDDGARSDVVTRFIKVTPSQDEVHAPEVVLTSPKNGSQFAPEQPITLLVHASDKDGDLAQVRYFINGKQVANSNLEPFSASTTLSEAGTYELYAVASDKSGLQTRSATHQIHIKEKAPGCRTGGWSAGTVYTAGNQVSYNGKLYQAKWWTRNQVPAEYSSRWAVWKVIGECK